MNNPIQTYDDLLKRKKQLEDLLQAQGELIKIDIEEIKIGLAPLHNAVTTLANFFTQDKKAGLLGFGANRLVDLLVRKVILSRSGWITKLIVPFFIKNFSSHFIAGNQEKWINNIKQWFSHNGHDKQKKESESPSDY